MVTSDARPDGRSSHEGGDELTTAYANKTCEELHAALAAAKASIESPREHANTNISGAVEETGGMTEPASAQPDLLKEIEDIEQAMREAGCAEA